MVLRLLGTWKRWACRRFFEEVGTDEIRRVWIRDGGWPEAGSASFGRLRARESEWEAWKCGSWSCGFGFEEDGRRSPEDEDWLRSGRRSDLMKMNVGSHLKS